MHIYATCLSSYNLHSHFLGDSTVVFYVGLVEEKRSGLSWSLGFHFEVTAAAEIAIIVLCIHFQTQRFSGSQGSFIFQWLELILFFFCLCGVRMFSVFIASKAEGVKLLNPVPSLGGWLKCRKFDAYVVIRLNNKIQYFVLFLLVFWEGGSFET